MIPRTARNNNPGDLDHGPAWQGIMPESERSPEQKSEPRFDVFLTPEYGFRALTLLLRNYALIYGANSVDKIIDRFAPEGENPVAEYKAYVAHDLGVGITDHIDQSKRAMAFKLAKSIATFETGSWAPYWSDSELNVGLDMAGFPKEALVA